MKMKFFLVVLLLLTQLFLSAQISVSSTNSDPGIVPGKQIKVGIIKASDPDRNQTLTYSIKEGNSGKYFSIDSPSGMLLVSQSVYKSFDTERVFVLTIFVQDNGRPVQTSKAIITVIPKKDAKGNPILPFIWSEDKTIIAPPNEEPVEATIKTISATDNAAIKTESQSAVEKTSSQIKKMARKADRENIKTLKKEKQLNSK